MLEKVAATASVELDEELCWRRMWRRFAGRRPSMGMAQDADLNGLLRVPGVMQAAQTMMVQVECGRGGGAGAGGNGGTAGEVQ